MSHDSRALRDPDGSGRARTRIVLRALALGVVLAGAGPRPAWAQSGEGTARPRVGLVLAGGGARGGAHVGALRVLEEMRVPIDMIAGTSMGAVIGGAYASGMSVDEIEALLAGIDWSGLFRPEPPRPDLTFRRKEDTRAFSTDLEIGFDGRDFDLTPSVVPSHGLNLLFRTITLPVADVRDFDDLPVPYRAVATDATTAEMVVLGEGDLARAMQASMAIPGVFEPMEIDGRLLVDGGVVRNLPVDVVREMGADVVIAVDVGEPLLERDELGDPIGMLTQTMNILIYLNATASVDGLTTDDVLIVPDLEGFGVASFDEIAGTVEPGEEATRAAAEALARFALPEEQYAPYRSRLRPATTSLRLDFVEIVNETGLSDPVIRALLGIHPGEELSVSQLDARLTRLKGAGDFEQVDFRIERRGDRQGIVVTPRDKSWGPGFLRFGLAIREDGQSASTFDFLARFTLTRLNRRGGELRAEAELGELRRAHVEWYQPLDQALRIFSAVAGEYRSLLEGEWDGDTQVAQYRSRLGGLGVGAGSRLGLWGQARLGLLWERPSYKPIVGSPDLSQYGGTQSSIVAELNVDELDDPWFPEHGAEALVRLKHSGSFLGGDFDFDRLEGVLGGAASRGRSALVAAAAAGTSMGSELPPWEQFRLGGFGRLSGLRWRQLQGNYYGFGSLTYFHRIGRPRGLAPIGGFRLGASVETGNTWLDRDAIAVDDLRFSGSLFLGFETLVGPVFLAYGHTDGGEISYYFFLGRIF